MVNYWSQRCAWPTFYVSNCAWPAN